MDSTEEIYCAEQIKIPVNFPYILKVYVKAAIRTQPYDLLRWSSAYFRAMAEGKIPPVKERLEYPPNEHPSRITPYYLKSLLNQYGHVQSVTLESLLTSWHEIGFSESSLYQILTIGQLLKERVCDFYQFLAIACGLLGNNLFETMVYVCELLTEEPEGGSAMIPLKTFLSLYGYLANLNCTGEPEASDLCFCESVSDVGDEEEDEIKEKEQAEKKKPKEKISQETVSDLSSYCVDQIDEETEASSRTAADDELSHKDAKDEVTEIPEGEEDQAQPIEDSKILDSATVEQVEEDHKDETTTDEEGTIEVEKNQPEIVILFDHCDQRTEIKSANDDPVVQEDQETRRNSFEIEEETKKKDAEEKEVKRTDEWNEDDDYSFSFKGEKTEVSSFDDEYIENESKNLENLLEGSCESVEEIVEMEVEEEINSLVDLVEEFLTRMKVEFPNPCELLKVAGIGPKVSEETVTRVGLWLGDCSRRQNGVVGPRNMRHFLCPHLDDYPAHEDYERTKLKCP